MSSLKCILIHAKFSKLNFRVKKTCSKRSQCSAYNNTVVVRLQRRRRSISASWLAKRYVWGRESRSAWMYRWPDHLHQSSHGRKRTSHFHHRTGFVSGACSVCTFAQISQCRLLWLSISCFLNFKPRIVHRDALFACHFVRAVFIGVSLTSGMKSRKQLLGVDYTGWPKKTSRTLRNYNAAYTSWSEISFGTFVDQYVLLLTYKFQWSH